MCPVSGLRALQNANASAVPGVQTKVVSHGPCCVCHFIAKLHQQWVIGEKGMFVTGDGGNTP